MILQPFGCEYPKAYVAGSPAFALGFFLFYATLRHGRQNEIDKHITYQVICIDTAVVSIIVKRIA